ncbi:aryl-sulfate sulfotransferase [candidate division KSB1 bacterium]|nr:aryl-sulfate sulfotransferase [candidate division KSB1 bacterium]
MMFLLKNKYLFVINFFICILYGTFIYCEKDFGTGNNTVVELKNIQARPNENNSISQYIDWETDIETGSMVVYGLTTEYDSRVELAELKKRHTVLLLGLLPDTLYYFKCAAVINGREVFSNSCTFRTGSLPDDLPTINITESDSLLYQNGINMNYVFPYILAFDMRGRYVWYYKIPGTYKAYDPIKKLPNGNLIIGIDYSQIDEGRIIEMNMGGQIVSDIKTTGYHHDFYVLPDGHIAYIKAVVRDVNGTNFVGDEITEIDPSGQIIWNWSSFDYLDTNEFDPVSLESFYYGDKGKDWTHANELIFDGSDQSYIFSIRHLNKIIKIDRQTRQILWEFGGIHSDFQLPEEDKFYHQHAPELKNDTILLFDNGNHRPGVEFSRVIEYQFDWNGQSVLPVWEFRLSGENFFTPNAGDVDRLENGNILIATSKNYLIEVSPTREIVWNVFFENTRARIHRVLRLESLY